jgi:RNA polymerase sigma-70 factor (ECF subfamily)
MFPIHDNHDPMSMLIAKETESRINDAIDTLPEQCRRVFLMWWKDGFKYDEIAEKSGVSIGTVKVQINRARTKLLETLENME